MMNAEESENYKVDSINYVVALCRVSGVQVPNDEVQGPEWGSGGLRLVMRRSCHGAD